MLETITADMVNSITFVPTYIIDPVLSLSTYLGRLIVVTSVIIESRLAGPFLSKMLGEAFKTIVSGF